MVPLVGGSNITFIVKEGAETVAIVISHFKTFPAATIPLSRSVDGEFAIAILPFADTWLKDQKVIRCAVDPSVSDITVDLAVGG